MKEILEATLSEDKATNKILYDKQINKDCMILLDQQNFQWLEQFFSSRTIVLVAQQSANHLLNLIEFLYYFRFPFSW